MLLHRPLSQQQLVRDATECEASESGVRAWLQQVYALKVNTDIGTDTSSDSGARILQWGISI